MIAYFEYQLFLFYVPMQSYLKLSEHAVCLIQVLFSFWNKKISFYGNWIDKRPVISQAQIQKVMKLESELTRVSVNVHIL